MDKRLIMGISIALVFLFVGSMVSAQLETGQVTGVKAQAKTSKAMILDKERMRFDSDTRLQIRTRLGNIEDADADRLRVLGLDVTKIERLNIADRERLMTKIRARVSEARLAEFREIESMKRIQKDRIAKIRLANANDDVRMRWIERLKLAEESAATVEDDAVRAELAAVRAKLEAATTMTTELETEVAARMLKLYRTNAEERGERAIVLASTINDKLTDFIARMESAMDGREAPRAMNALEKLKSLQANLQVSINDAQATQAEAVAEDATRDEVKAYHSALVEMKVYATRGVSAMRQLVMAWDARGNNDDIEEVRALEIDDAATIAQVDVDAEVMAEVDATAVDPTMVEGTSPEVVE